MISPDLIVLSILIAWSAAVGFVAYWRGVATQEARLRRLQRELDDAIDTIAQQGMENAMLRHPSNTSRSFVLIQGGAS